MPNLKVSRFNAYSRSLSNELIVYNSYTGAIGIVPSEQEGLAREVIKPNNRVLEEEVWKSPLLKEMVDSGFLVSEYEDEFKKASELHKNYYENKKILNLHILPTEQCNFRCVYCYESFLRGKMKQDIRDGIVNLVKNRSEEIDVLTVSWFGGEPTEALDVIYELSEEMIKICQDNNVDYYAGMTTNGYNLTPDVFAKLVETCRVTSYQISIDGCKEHHDTQRVKMDGSSTYDTIITNLVSMKSTDFDFTIQIRNNFTPESYQTVDIFFTDLSEKIGQDPRFAMHFHPVGKWGGPNDSTISVCEGKDAAVAQFELFNKAVEYGFSDFVVLQENLNPGGSVCYAGKPWSFVIGSDGTVYKCTVVFDDDRNKVGRLDKTGELNLDEEKFRLWTTSNESIDSGCQKCFFRPSCQGAACPWERIQSGESPCPTPKKYIKRALTAVAGRT